MSACIKKYLQSNVCIYVMFIFLPKTESYSQNVNQWVEIGKNV